MLREIKATIGNKRAGASVYLGVILMLMAFLTITICVNIFHIYSIDVRAQLIADAIADGSAVAGQTPLGFDEKRMRIAANEIFELNNNLPSASLEYSIAVKDEVVNGDYTGHKIVTVVVAGTSNLFYTEILDLFDNTNDLIDSTFSVGAKSVVRAKTEVSSINVLSQSYFDNGRHLLPTVNIVTTAPGTRLPSYITWLINYYLCPEYNPIYQADSVAASKNGHLLLDYLKHMGIYSEPHSAESILTGDGATFFASHALQEATPAIMQHYANTGEVVFFVCRDKSSQAAEIYIVVPSKNPLEQNCVAVAFANNKTSNYMVIDLDNFVLTHDEIKVFYYK